MKLFYFLILDLLFACTTKQNRNIKPVQNLVQVQTKHTVITQSATHLKSADDLKITIKAEPLTDTSSVRVKINGIDIPFFSNGIVSTAKYITTGTGSGQYKVYATVTHYKRDKEMKTENDTVTYFIDK